MIKGFLSITEYFIIISIRLCRPIWYWNLAKIRSLSFNWAIVLTTIFLSQKVTFSITTPNIFLISIQLWFLIRRISCNTLYFLSIFDLKTKRTWLLYKVLWHSMRHSGNHPVTIFTAYILPRLSSVLHPVNVKNNPYSMVCILHHLN